MFKIPKACLPESERVVLPEGSDVTVQDKDPKVLVRGKPAQSVIERLQAQAIKLKNKELKELLEETGFVPTKTQEILAELITEDEYMKRIKRKVEKLATLNDPVLIFGESGTGKEVIARALAGDRKFVAVNAAALSESLLESELFGHAKGSFTGAINDRIGKIREANNGVLFLDEAQNIPNSTQEKLLRVLQDKKVTPVGSEQSYDVNFRLVSACNSKLIDEVAGSGKVRLDFYWRIAVHLISITPLRHRRNDIREILDSILDPDHELEEKFRDYLVETCDLMGNYRELEARVKRQLIEDKLARELLNVSSTKRDARDTPSKDQERMGQSDMANGDEDSGSHHEQSSDIPKVTDQQAE